MGGRGGDRDGGPRGGGYKDEEPPQAWRGGPQKDDRGDSPGRGGVGDRLQEDGSGPQRSDDGGGGGRWRDRGGDRDPGPWRRDGQAGGRSEGLYLIVLTAGLQNDATEICLSYNVTGNKENRNNLSSVLYICKQ